jgi:hypothetical protein
MDGVQPQGKRRDRALWTASRRSAVPACGGTEMDVHPRRGITAHVKDKENRSRLASDKRDSAAATSSLTRMHPVAGPGNAGM